MKQHRISSYCRPPLLIFLHCSPLPYGTPVGCKKSTPFTPLALYDLHRNGTGIQQLTTALCLGYSSFSLLLPLLQLRHFWNRRRWWKKEEKRRYTTTTQRTRRHSSPPRFWLLSSSSFLPSPALTMMTIRLPWQCRSLPLPTAGASVLSKYASFRLGGVERCRLHPRGERGTKKKGRIWWGMYRVSKPHGPQEVHKCAKKNAGRYSGMPYFCRISRESARSFVASAAGIAATTNTLHSSLVRFCQTENGETFPL